MKETKVCPFRKGETGAFAICYGNTCMAYLEYDMPVLSGESSTEHVVLCKMMQHPITYPAAHAV